ncbi:MAG: amidohydrolase [Lewinellaceae bacterium]|nr:amidohydrolase [Lewinellaceae bacterium]
MQISILQTALHWEDPVANRAMLAQKMNALKSVTDIVVLPEMFTTGFSMNARVLAEPMEGPTVNWLSEQAADIGAVVTGSFICLEDGHYYNRMVWMYPNGSYQYYDKRHGFSLAGEHEVFTRGRERLLVEWKGWRICPMVCYDLRFPVWLRQQKTDRYDLLVLVANWPDRRAHHWRTLLEARAIENQAYLAGVNIVGHDGKGLAYNGDSSLIDFSGQVMCRISGEPGLFTGTLSLEALRQYRQQFPFLNDADDFEVF